MRIQKRYALPAVALALAGCGDGRHDDNHFDPIPPSWAPVVLATASDVERELGNISTTLSLTVINTGVATPALGPGHAPSAAFAATQQPRARQQPHATDANCTAGGGDAVSSGAKNRTFAYFNVTATVNYVQNHYSGCANSSNGTLTTEDGLEEGGASGSSYGYQVLGDLPANNTLTIYTDGVDANNVPLHTQQDYYGLLEQNTASSVDTRANLFSTLFTSQPNQPDYDGSLQIGDSGGVYEVIQGDNSLNIGGTYAYASTACLGGAVTVTTPATLGLGDTTAGSGLPVSGSLGLASGRNSVTLSFNPDGSASLSGSVSGSIDAATVGRILQNGTSC